MARKNDIVRVEEDDEDLPLVPFAGQQLIQGVARSVSALESIAKSLIERQDQNDATVKALVAEVTKLRKENRNNTVMTSQAASEAEALNSIGLNLRGPIRYGADGRGAEDGKDNFEAYMQKFGEMIEGGKLPPESDPRF